MSMQPFERQELVDKPGIIGAKWWHATLVDEASKIVRRDAIRSILIAGGVIAGFGALLGMCIKAAKDDSAAEAAVKDDRKTTLDMQKEYGWNFGFVGEPLVFDGATSRPFDPSALPSLARDLRPSRADLVPYFQPTLFQSPYAMPKSLATAAPEEAALFRPLAEALKPISTPAMDAAYAKGKSFASLFASLADSGKSPADTKAALVVDLPGPEAVAFAAGAARVFDPVFLFDNWPHPKGVVRAHETLSAAAYYQPLFTKERGDGKQRLPMFVLDRNRLTKYTDDASQFDNRYIAKLPWPATAMNSLNVARVFYVVPRTGDLSTELDDLNDDFVGYEKGNIDVKSVALDAFSTYALTDAGREDPRPPAPPGKTLAGTETSDTLLGESGWYYYGGRRTSHYAFFNDYGMGPSPRPATQRPAFAAQATRYSPTPRTTPYSSGTGTSSATKSRPTSFATVPVVVAVGTGAILGAKYARSGSWNRSSGGWGG
jgi:hypothetical protein